MRRSSSRLSAALFATTLLGVVAVATSSAAASGLTWSETVSPQTSFVPAFSSTTPALERAGNDLADVSCTSRTFCIAVGVESNSTGGPTLTEEWDGRRWIVSPRSSVVGTTALVAVSCTSPRFCVAAGNTGTTPGNTQPIIEIYNGIGWTYTLLNPYPTHTSSELRDVSCTSPIACVAVGSTDVGTAKRTMVESWNGVAWSVVASPNSGAGNNTLSGVSCRTRFFCVAVGAFVTAANTTPLLEIWNGTTWALVAGAALPSGSFAQLEGVSCPATTFCMATGSVDQSPLAETWRGAAWVSAPVPPPRPGYSQRFAGVSCTGTRHCVAALDRSGPSPASAGGLAEEWNGSSWADGSGAPGESGALHGVSCSGKRFCFVVGGSHYFPHGSVAIRGV